MAGSGGCVRILGTIAALTSVDLPASIIFRDIDDVPLFLGNPTKFYSVDFDQDGGADLVFRSDESDFRVTSTATSWIAGLPARPPDSGNFSAVFNAGTPVGLSLQSPWSWNGGPSFLTACVLLGSEPVCLGFWGQNIDYVGVQFLIGGQTHYGWVEVEVPLLGVNGGFVRSFAYETQPGVPILAGAVPEPSALLLLISGLAVPLCRRWRCPAVRRGEREAV
jgi:hypothetical protein